jgi:hypothetical protein
MDALLRHAGEILETAAEAQAAEGLPAADPSEYLIAILRAGSIRMIADVGGLSGHSPPALGPRRSLVSRKHVRTHARPGSSTYFERNSSSPGRAILILVAVIRVTFVHGLLGSGLPGFSLGDMVISSSVGREYRRRRTPWAFQQEEI